MARSAPMVRSFNAGEFSILMEGRTDLDRYPASQRKMLNAVAAPQGPSIPRGGTSFVNTVYSRADESTLIPFIFDDDVDFYMIEFSNLRCRFFTESGGILTRAASAAVVTTTAPFAITSAALTALGADVGYEVALGGFASNYNLNGVVAKITAKVGDLYTLDLAFPGLPNPGAITAALVYHIVSPYTSAQAKKLREVQSLDVLYLYSKGMKTRKLRREDTYDWSFETVAFQDGPYLPVNETGTTLTPSATGKHTPNMTTNTAPAGWTASGTTIFSAAYDYFKAFDDPANNTWWETSTNQYGTLQIQAPAAFICDGYSIHIATDNQSTTYASKDYAPSDFSFEGSNDGVTWTTLDVQNDYVLYDSHKSVFFEIKNTTAYSYYRLDVRALTRNGNQNVRVKSLILRSTTSTSITFTASSTTGINNDTGFQATDVGRLLRVQGTDQAWRWFEITAVTDTTHVVATLKGEPFVNLQPSFKWRLGYWSDTTGYPHYGLFDGDRLWSFGSESYPDLFAFSVTGRYEQMSPSDSQGVVLATNGYAGRLNTRRLTRIRWAEDVKDGIVLGAGSQNYLLSSNDANSKTISPLNVEAKPVGSRGSNESFPVKIDSQILFIPRGGRAIREMTYAFESDAYKTPSMSALASHLGASPFVKMAYAEEPYSIVWTLRTDGRLVGLTYNRDENVVGWHRHKFIDNVENGVDVEAFVESIAVMPSADQLQDVLWLVVRRVVNGVTQRYIERLTQFWDFGLTLDDAHFVDSALRYSGAPTATIYGLTHLEGNNNVYGLADNNPVGPLTVINGSVTLPAAASNVILGIGFDSEGETSRLENGAADGTAQGKVGRIHKLAMMLWNSYGGEIGVHNEDTGQIEYEKVEIPPLDPEATEQVYLFDGIVKGITPPPGYETFKSIAWRRPRSSPLPWNIVALMPQMDTQDGG